jgi:DNA-binding transcriptional regulator LsrR (DeoR family)
MFDKDGNEVASKERCPIAASLSALRNASWSIGMGATKQKAEATIAAIKAKYINTLVIDQNLATEMLRSFS